MVITISNFPSIVGRQGCGETDIEGATATSAGIELCVCRWCLPLRWQFVDDVRCLFHRWADSRFAAWHIVGSPGQ